MRAIVLIVAAACLALAGCQTSRIDTAIQANLPRICSGASIAHSAFTVFAAGGSISAATQRREEAAWNALQPLCVDPSSQTAGSALASAVASYAIIAKALAEAKRAETEQET